MKQSEKREKTYKKILLAAIEEFGKNGYDNSSLNTICSKYNISKGLIYHNFKNKDELYLCSVKECFVKLLECLKNGVYSDNSEWENMKKLLMVRQEFFEEFPDFRNIFFSAVLFPPNHLIKEIQIIRKEYDSFNIERLKRLLKNVKLRDGITENMAISYFLIYQEMFNGYYQNKIYQNKDLLEVSKEHNLKILPILDIMLYGIVSEEKDIQKEDVKK